MTTDFTPLLTDIFGLKDDDPLSLLRDAYNEAIDAVLNKNDYLRAFECPHCTEEDTDGVELTPCQLAFREWKSPEWIATQSAEAGKHNCPINLVCWQAANRYLVMRDFGVENDKTWQEMWQQN